MMSPSQILTSALAALLAASVLVNIGLGRAWLAARDDATTAIGQRDTARADASACSDATDDLRTLADQRAIEAQAARADGAAHQARSMAVFVAFFSTSTAAQAVTTNGSSVLGVLLALLAAGTMAPSVWPTG